MRWLFSSEPLSNKGVASLRIVIGVLMVIHGTQIFYTGEMVEYGSWMKDLGFPIPMVFAYTGKAIELLGGLCLMLGVFMRVACMLLMLTFLFITIVMGGGKILTDAQHPFMFFLFSALFFYCGNSGYSVTRLIR